MKRLKLLASCLTALSLFQPARSAPADSVAELLQATKRDAVSLPVHISYRFSRTASKYKGTPEQLAAKVAAFSRQIEATYPKQNGDAESSSKFFMAEYEKSLTLGSSNKYEGDAIISDKYLCVAEKNIGDEKGGVEWHIKLGEASINYSEHNRTATISTYQTQRQTPLSLFMDTVGLFGSAPSGVVKRLQGGQVISSDHQQYVMSAGPSTITVVKQPNGTLAIQSYDTKWQESGNAIGVKYVDYKDYNLAYLPSIITRTVSTPDFDVTSTYQILSIEKASDTSRVPFVNDDVGIIPVTDMRFVHPIDYYVKSKLPEDTQIAEWLTDPKALQNYNATMRAVAR